MKNQAITVNGKQFTILFIGKTPAGYGHNTLTCRFLTGNGQQFEHKTTTNDTLLTDRMNDDDETVEAKARLEAADLVISKWLESI